jgi:mannose-1-phosphate guanylyltransferase/mannose-6-phosphate isomerase
MSTPNPPLLVQPVIMAGGSGTRLWPLSRALHPKQFLVLHGDHSLFQQAARRLAALGEKGMDVAAPCVVGNEEHRFLVLEQLREIAIEPSVVLLEPAGRNTAPALTLAALQVQEQDPVLVVAAADHDFADEAALVETLRLAVREAAGGALVTLGVRPERPETGYGYIRAAGSGPVRVLERFVEKPDAATAQRYLAEGSYFWNSGIFVLRASVWLKALRAHRPDIADATERAWAERSSDARFLRPGRAAFEAIPSESIDYAVMEPVAKAGTLPLRMVPLAAGWSDLGSWEAVWQVNAKDADGNVAHGDTIVRDSRQTLVHATSRLVSVVGIDNAIVVETPDAVLVIDRARSQEVKQVVAALAAGGRSEGSLHRQVHRPWGWYDGIDAGPRFQVKRIMVKPGASLSLQMHHHRAEHWIVVKGTAEVTRGNEVTLLSENQSIYIPIGERHRLANPGKVPLEIIEVQSGAYLGEDDIVRFDDHYGRGP